SRGAARSGWGTPHAPPVARAAGTTTVRWRLRRVLAGRARPPTCASRDRGIVRGFRGGYPMDPRRLFSTLLLFLAPVGLSQAGQFLAPVEVVATSGVSGRVDLSWVDTNMGEKGYLILRSERSDGGFSGLDVTAPDSSSYTDQDVADGRTYFYRVRAVGRKS